MATSCVEQGCYRSQMRQRRVRSAVVLPTNLRPLPKVQKAGRQRASVLRYSYLAVVLFLPPGNASPGLRSELNMIVRAF